MSPRGKGLEPFDLDALLRHADPGAVLVAVMRRIADEQIVAARIGAAETFTSEALPPRTSRRAFAEWCRSGQIEGARKEGRAWMCSATAWHAARSRSPEPAPRLRLVKIEPSIEELTERALEGVRRGGSR
jgi:hypothetical protein